MSRRTDVEEMVEWTMKYCQHYEPGGITMIGGKEPSGCCKAGVVYLKQFGEAPDDGTHTLNDKHYPSSGIFQRICCTSGGERSEAEQLAACPKWLRATREQGVARFEAAQEADRRYSLVMPVVAEWRKKPPKGKQEVIECPACKGRLHLSQAAVNGHVWGNCETKGCMQWME